MQQAAQSRATQRSAHAWSPNKSNKMCEQHANACFARRVWTRGGGGCTLHLLCKPINTVQARESHHRGATTPTASRSRVHVECIRWQAKKRQRAARLPCDPTTFLRWVGCGRERWLWVVPCRCRTRLGRRRGVSLRGTSAWRERTDARTATTVSRWCVCVDPAAWTTRGVPNNPGPAKVWGNVQTFILDDLHSRSYCVTVSMPPFIRSSAC
jgi:hypothetical protein